MSKSLRLAGALASVALLAACKTTQPDTAPATAGGTGTDTTAGSGTTGGTGGGSVPALVSVNLQNVLNDLSISLQVDRNSIPVTAQVPIDVAASVCGVSVDVLAASVASGKASCTATSTSAQLTQVVQQQISTGGDVQGGDQTTTTPGG